MKFWAGIFVYFYFSATFQSSPTWSVGKIGSGITTDGSDYLSTNLDIYDLYTGGGFTVEAWTYDSASSTYDAVLSSFKSTPYEGFYLRRDTGGSLMTCDIVNAGGFNTISAPTEQNVWNHWSCTYSSGSLKLYKNGVLQSEDASASMSDPLNKLIIGANYVGSENWNGKLDEVKVYPYARTPSQIAWDYNNGKPIAHWKMEELTTPSYDSSGNNYHLTWNGNVAQTTGKFNSGTVYDGASDYLSCTDASCGGIGKLDFGAGSSFSFGTWFKTSTIAPDVFLNKKFAPSSALSPGYVTYIDASGYIYCAIADGVTQKNLRPTGTNYADNAWHHVICTVDSTTISQYVDGRLTGSTTNTVTGSYDTTEDFKTAINGGNNNDYVGSLDDTRIYNYALNAQQVKMIYNENSAIRFGP